LFGDDVQKLQLLQPVLAKTLQTMLADSQPPKQLTTAMTAGYVELFARLLLTNPQFFMAFVGNSAPNMLDFLLDKIETVAEPQKRKLVALALCRLIIAANDEWILLRLRPITSLVLSVLHSVEGDLGYDFFVVSLDANGFVECLAARERQQLYARDPVNCLNLRLFAQQQLASVSTGIGEQRLRQLLAGDWEELCAAPPHP